MLYQTKKFMLTNTASGRREEFTPATPGKVLFYSCGPTVYGPIHIGNARALMFADLLYRWLKYIGYDVNFVRNYTDVDDKIIARAKQENIPAQEVAEKAIESCEDDMKHLGLLAPVKVVRVTESIADIVKMIQTIIARGHAYVVEGEVLFSIATFERYGKLSGRNIEDLVAGARVEVDGKKRNPMDFSLWKPHKPGEPYWDSPWGKGRPGWHIECSAMASRWLGDTIDLHHGGQDLVFPHHENEVAQSESASGKPFCRHWVHHGFITAGNEKMSKSLGNIMSCRDFNSIYGAEVLKFIFASFHYRSEVPYTEETMSQALGELERVYLLKRWAMKASEEAVADGKGAAFAPLIGKAHEAFARIEDDLFADLNTPGALGQLFGFIRDVNRAEAQAAGKPGIEASQSSERRQVAAECLTLLNEWVFPLLNVFGEDPQTVLAKIDAIRRKKQKTALSDDEIRKLIEERNAARKARDFKRSDEIRASLDSQGITLVDSPQGTTWKAKS